MWGPVHLQSCSSFLLWQTFAIFALATLQRPLFCLLGSMAAKKLRRAQLSQEMCERLSRYQITTCQDFLCLSLLELMKVTGQSYYEVQKLLCKVSRACAPKMQTAYEMKLRKSANPSSAFLSTTLHSLDTVLHGGVPCGSLTEITSPPGCGKTQFCIMLSVLATLPVSMGGLDGAVIYIDTESAFSAERLIEIAANRFPAYYDSDEKLLCMTRSIHLYRELTCCSVLKRIMSLEEEIILKKVKLVIIDSVASVVRKEFDTKLQGNLAERSNFLTRGASVLKYLAEEFSIPAPEAFCCGMVLLCLGRSFLKQYGDTLAIVAVSTVVILTNQITTALSSGPGVRADLVSPADDLSLSEVLVPNGVKTLKNYQVNEDSPRDQSVGSSVSGKRDSGYVTAALGNTWSHSVNTRLILQYHDLPTRQLLVAKSPVAQFSTFFYTIEKSGLILQDQKDENNLVWEGTNPALQPIRVRNTALKDTLHDAALPSTTGETSGNTSNL
ncbi:DNA repair protein RAD51 homolog 2 isoform X1 [Motacilla alba alba]|uniref:DNA repair protein RAD51 homolog 2 isoform X1 n=1 Tax=Motacilla alba alba TaxID=1094192 RepID=UPI0018D5538F|nr:DNA repair protein RAD51 homolog 2 isoform X1 [Motacilla alba alba]